MILRAKTSLYSKSPQKSNFLHCDSMFFGFSTPKIGGRSFTRFFQKMAPGGGGVLPHFTRRGTNYLHTTLLKTYPKSNFLDYVSIRFGFSAPKIGGVLMKTFSKGSFTRFFQKMAPGGGGLSDFTRRGTNYLHTFLLKTYPKSNFLDYVSMFLGFSAPKIGGILTKTFSKGSFTRFFQKMAPPGGGRFTRFHQTWH